MRDLPRVLILNQPFNSQSGGGITLSNLFSDWDRDKLAVLCPSYLINDGTEGHICQNYYQLGSKEHKWLFPFNFIAKKHYSGPLLISREKSLRPNAKSASLRKRLLSDYLNPMFRATGMAHWISRYELSDELKNWLNAFNADIIYAQAQRRENLLFCLVVQKYLNKPMVFHMMDDWVAWVPKGKIFGVDWSRQIDIDFREVLKASSLHLSISDLMAKEYQERYGYRFIPFHNPIDVDFWRRGQRQSYELSEVPEILYAGRVGLGISESLKIMARAITSLNKDLGLRIRFVIQSGDKEHWMDEYEVVQHRSFVEYSELPSRFGTADILFLPYEFAKEAIQFFKYSMPTKASEYMVCGTPILIFSPEEMAIVSYARVYGWAKVVTENSLDSLINALKELLGDTEIRQSIGTKAISVAAERHDGFLVRTEFMRLLGGLVNSDN